jgi:surface polysaccharide O-acyltransferase-like enzyme
MPKLYWITNLRVLATLSVVLLHAAANGSQKAGKIALTDWWICNIANTFGRFAVPVFVMISGFLLLGRYDDLSTFLSKRFKRVAIPFLVWTVFYIVWGNFYGIPSEKTNFINGQFWIRLLTGGGGGSFHLWFVYMLLGLYAFVPVVSRWLKTATDSEIIYFIILWFVSSTVYPWLNRWFGFQINYELRYFSGYIGYFVLGYWLGNKQLSLSNWLTGIIFLLAWGITAWVVFEASWGVKSYVNFYTDYLSPSVILMSISIFVFFKNALNHEFLPSVMSRLDALSYGIYLAHIWVMRILSRNYKINFAFKDNALIGVPLHFLLCMFLCFGLVWFLSKIPKSEWIIG